MPTEFNLEAYGAHAHYQLPTLDSFSLDTGVHQQTGIPRLQSPPVIQSPQIRVHQRTNVPCLQSPPPLMPSSKIRECATVCHDVQNIVCCQLLC
ncbi:unnamed protein product [Calicophoron daubneyi]|uniref:Sprouty n=1 Tax=Calicophoron daubneyi TaxID=300641 RepID=A0AAV2TYC3_CALDB